MGIGQIKLIAVHWKRNYFFKVDMIEETEYDEIIQCDHSYDSR